jgi:hypothetical protein
MSEKTRPIFLREWRKFRGLTLQDLGARAGINHGNLSKMDDPSILGDFWRLWDGASDSQKLKIAGYIKELLNHNR